MAPLASVVITRAVKFPAPSFSYQAILLSLAEAESTSLSPSPSMSPAWTEVAPLASVVITRVSVHDRASALRARARALPILPLVSDVLQP